jgi:ZIP family zinc transporter/zinc and cadmium transporter
MRPAECPLPQCSVRIQQEQTFAFRWFAGILPDSMSPITASILLGLTAGFANIFGGAVIVQRHWDRRFLRYFIALGAGFMLGTALLEMVPESFALSPHSAGQFILLGYFLMHFFEHTISGHFHFGEETHADEFGHPHRGYSVLLGLVIHTFFDGIAITSGFLVSNLLGWLIFVAVFLHKVPEGFTVSSVMLASGRSRTAAWGSSILLAGATLAGVLTMLAWRRSVGFGLPVSAGVTIYVAASDLIPEVNREPGVKMALVVFLGVGLMFALVHLFQIP